MIALVSVTHPQKKKVHRFMHAVRFAGYTATLYVKATPQCAYFVYLWWLQHRMSHALVFRTTNVYTPTTSPWFQVPASLLEDPRNFTLMLHNNAGATAEYQGKTTAYRVPVTLTPVADEMHAVLDTVHNAPSFKVPNEYWIKYLARQSAAYPNVLLFPNGIAALDHHVIGTRPMPAADGFISNLFLPLFRPASLIAVAATPTMTWVWGDDDQMGFGTAATPEQTDVRRKVQTTLQNLQRQRTSAHQLAISLPMLRALRAAGEHVRDTTVLLRWHGDTLTATDHTGHVVTTITVGHEAPETRVLTVHSSFFYIACESLRAPWNVLYWPAHHGLPVELEGDTLRFITPCIE